jgi:hypothetical protein
MTMITEGPHAGDYLLSESNGALSREAGVIAAGAALVAGTVLGQLTKDAPALSKVSGTGVATFGTPTLTKLAEVGVYTIKCTAAVNGGTPAQFSVTSPSGYALPTLAAATAYTSSHFTLTDAGIPAGTTAWAPNDVISLTVTGSGQYVQHDPDAVTGAADAVAVLYEGVDASQAAADCVLTARLAEVDDAALTWHTGITAPEKAAAVASLATRNIIVR